jgi:carbon monoxide dehydrogenase subunit G
VSTKVGPLKARFNGQVELSDVDPPAAYTLTGEGRGGPAGHAKVRADVRLDDDGGATRLRYDVRADIGGKLAQLGGTLVQKTAEKQAAEFFRNFEQIVAADGGAAGGEVGGGEPVAATTGGARRLWLAAGVVALALVVWLATR